MLLTAAGINRNPFIAAQKEARGNIISYISNFILAISKDLLPVFSDLAIIWPWCFSMERRLLFPTSATELNLYRDTYSPPLPPKVITGGKRPASKCFKHTPRVQKNPSAAERRAGAIHGVWEIVRGEIIERIMWKWAVARCCVLVKVSVCVEEGGDTYRELINIRYYSTVLCSGYINYPWRGQRQSWVFYINLHWTEQTS